MTSKLVGNVLGLALGVAIIDSVVRRRRNKVKRRVRGLFEF